MSGGELLLFAYLSLPLACECIYFADASLPWWHSFPNIGIQLLQPLTWTEDQCLYRNPPGFQGLTGTASWSEQAIMFLFFPV